MTLFHSPLSHLPLFVPPPPPPPPPPLPPTPPSPPPPPPLPPPSYGMVEKVDSQLRRMGHDLKEVIEQMNAATSAQEEDSHVSS